MKFRELADLFHNLESTTKRLEMIDMLADFFQKILNSQDFADLKKIIYLLQGQLVSNIKQVPKMGLAEKMIIEALKVPSGWSSKEIKEELIKQGDIGATAEIMLSKRKNKKQKSLMTFMVSDEKELEKPSIEISELYENLRKIANTQGSGSNDIKLNILKKLIQDLSPREIKYLLRIITSTLRVGVSTQTIIDGIALGFTDDKTNRDFIERAYNLHPDLGDIVSILAEQGLEKVKEVQISYGIPIRNMLASRVPYPEIPAKLGTPFIAEYKLDGERLQIHKEGDSVKLFSRRLLEISEQYPDVCRYIVENVDAERVILEGEVVAMDHFYEKMLPFQVLSKRRRKYDVKEMIKEVPVTIFLFDLLKLDEEQYIDYPLPKRRKKLEEIVQERDEVQLVKSVTINNGQELVAFFKQARERGNEGVMTKSIQENSVYQAGNRGFLWIKLKGLEGGKLKDSIDVALVGAFYGKGRRTGVYGTYIGAVYDPENNMFEAFTRIASGWTDDIMETLMNDIKQYEASSKPKDIICDDEPDVWIRPEIVIEIIGDEITISEKFSSLGYSMRFPVFQRFRPEKGPKDVTTVAEIQQLYETQ